MAATDGVPSGAGMVSRSHVQPLRWWVLSEDQWRTLRDVRLAALRESPRSFLSTYEKETAFGEERWRAEFSRGEWIIAGEEREQPQAFIGITSSDDIPPAGRYLEFLWVSPQERRCKVATRLIHAVLDRLEAAGMDTAWLWILDGNEPARQLYSSCGFTTTGVRQPVRPDRSLWEERMNCRLPAAEPAAQVDPSE